MKTTGIEWTDSTWNPIRGCSRVSEGCRNCYAESRAYRFSGPGQPYEGLVTIGETGERKRQWNGQVRFVEEHLLDPLKWSSYSTTPSRGEGRWKYVRPRRIFVNSMSDLFHPNVKDEWIDKIFAIFWRRRGRRPAASSSTARRWRLPPSCWPSDLAHSYQLPLTSTTAHHEERSMASPNLAPNQVLETPPALYFRPELSAYECLGCGEQIEVRKFAELMVDGTMQRVRVLGHPEHTLIWLELHQLDHAKCASFKDAARAKDYREHRKRQERRARGGRP
jgi:hypothetical protein